MSLFAIADLHLPLSVDKPMDIFEGWDNYVERLEHNWRNIVTEKDCVVVAGDISWAMNLQQTKADFSFLHNLPGKKILLKGNHDYWWSTRRKMEEFFSLCGFDTLSLLHNNAEVVGDFAVCGTRGWFFDAEQDENNKVLLREVGRLKRSIEAAKKTGKQPVVFLHYPPLFDNSQCEEIMSVLREYCIKQCFYGHIHGKSAKRIAERTVFGIKMKLISCDAVDFKPVLVG